MSSTTTAKPPRRMRLAGGAVSVPTAQFRAWHDLAIEKPRLIDLDRAILSAIAQWYRRLQARDYPGSLSHVRMAQRLDTDAINVRWAVDRLVRLGLIAVKPGAGGRANTYLPALPPGQPSSSSRVGWP